MANIVDDIADALSRRILRGELAPGSRLPPVRALAEQEGVNVSTVQRVLVRLEERGLVRSIDRSGIEVCDPSRHGGAALWPLVLRDAHRHPERALRLLEDVLETRRVIALHVVSALPSRAALALRGVIDALDAIVDADPKDLDAIAIADLEVTRVILRLADKPAALAIYNDVESVIRSQRSLLEAFYADPRQTVDGWRAFVAALESGALSAHPEVIAPLMQAGDERALAAFARRLTKDTKGTSHEPPRNAPRGRRHPRDRKPPRRPRA